MEHESMQPAGPAIWRRMAGGGVTKEQARDSGMAFVLLLLFAAAARRKEGYVLLAIAAQVVSMTAPQLFKPFAVVWFGLSHLLGAVMSKVLMGLVFFGVVTPIALWRRLSGHDALTLKSFKAGRGSVMSVRDHTYTARDMEQPY